MATAFAAAMVLGVCIRTFGEQGEILFAEANRHVSETLTKRPIGEWADALWAERMSTHRDALVKICVLKRAGRLDDARDAIDAASAMNPPVPTRAMADLADSLVRHERHAERALARRVYEQFPDAWSGVAYASVSHWKDDGATPEQIEDWLADRVDLNSKWEPLYYQTLQSTNRLAIVLDPLKAAFDADPAADRAIDYVVVARVGNIDCTRIFESTKATLRSEMLDLAHFSDTPLWRARWLERALDTHWTPADDRRKPRREIHAQQQAIGMDPRVGDAVQMRGEIIRAYREANQPKLAQPHIDALATMPGSRAARVAAAVSGDASVERHLLEEEATLGNTAEYWLRRASFELARKQPVAAEAAFARAFELAPLDAERRHKDSSRYRSNVLQDWMRTKDNPYEFAWAKLADLPRDSLSVRSTMQAFTQFGDWGRAHRTSLRPDDQRLWSILSTTLVWAYSEESLLRAMIENATPNDRVEIVDRVLQLAANADLTRAKIGGFCLHAFMNDKTVDQRVMPLFDRVYRESPQASDRASAANAIFRISLAAGDWQKADALLPVLTERAELRDALSTTSDVAVAAAQAGASDDALRLWKQISNQDRLALSMLPNLARAGLRDELIAFYTELAKTEPRSVASREALQRLN